MSKAVLGLSGFLAVAGFAVGATFNWKGGQGSPASNDWSVVANWCENSGTPGSASDSVNLKLALPACTTGSSTCVQDVDAGVTVGTVTITGNSPTKMTLQVRDGILNYLNMYLNDYSVLDIDQNVDQNSSGYTTFISGDVWIDVANGTAMTADVIRVNDSIATLRISGAGQVKTGSVCANALADGARRELRLASGTLIISNDGPDFCQFISSSTDSNARSKLWVMSGASILLDTIQSGMCDCDMNFIGGNAQDERVEIDLDGDVNIQCGSCVTSMVGYVDIDLDGASFKSGILLISGRVSVSRSAAGGSVTSRQNICPLTVGDPGCSNCGEDCQNCPETCF